MSRQTGVATQSVADVAAEDVQSSALERAAVREVAAEAVFLDQRVGPSAGDPRPPADGLHRSFAGVRAVVRIADPDAERAQTTLELLAHLASQLGISLDHLDIRVDAEADTRTRSRGAGGLMAEGTVYLAPRRYSPRTREGKYLLAHEVAHAAQRSSGASSRGVVAPRLQAELEAHAAGEAFAAGRLLDPVRTSLPRWYVAADVDADRAQLNTVMARQHRGELARMHDLLSYSLFDWAITDNDVDGVLTILAGFQMVAARSLVGALTPKDRDRLLDNLSTSHYKDFRTQVLTVFWGCEGPLLLKFQSVVRAGLETMDLKQLDPLEAVAVNYALQSVSEPVRNALLSGKKHEELQSIQSYAQDPSTQDEIRQKEGKEITDALDEERKREETRKEAQKIFESERGAKELAPLVKEIKQSLAGSGSHHSAALTALIRLTDYLGDPVALRAIAQNLSGGTGTPPDERVTYEEKDYLDELIRQTPVQSLYPDTDLRRVFFRLLTFRPAYKNEEWAADLSRAGFFDLWMNSEDAFLAFQLVKALPEPSRKAFYQRNGGGDWANILKKMSRSQLESESMNLYTGGEDDRDRNALLTALLRDETWESRDTSRLDGLIRMAIAAGEHEFVFTQSQQRQAYARAWLKPIVDKYMLYDPNGVDARGRKRDHYSHEILEGTSWYETGITGAITGFIGGAASTTAQSIDFAFRSRNTLSLIGSLFTKSVGGQGLNLVEFQDIFGGSFMGLTFQGFAKLGREGQEAKEHHKGVNFADARWDTGNGILTLNAEHLELASISYPAPQGKLQTGRGAAYGFNLNLQYGTSDKPKPAVIDLRIDRLELDDVLWISSNSMLSINIARVFNLLVNIGSSSTDFDSLARPDQGFKWNILGSLWRIFTLGSEGKEMSAALLKPQDVPLGVNVSIGSISLSGFTTSGGQYIESIEVQDLVLRGGGDIESYQKALAASQQRLQRRLDAARQALARAATPEDRERSQREVNQLERQLAHVMEESEAVGTARSEIAALEAKKKQQPLTPQESERLRRLKAQFAGAVLDVGKVALKGLAGLTKGTVELENVHGQGRSLAGALSLVSADFLAGMIAGEAGRPVIKGQDQQVFSLDVGRIDLPSITLVGSIPTEKKAREDLERFQAKLQPWRPSHQAELKRLQDRVTLAAQREALMRKPGITNLTPDQRAEFNGLEKQLQDLEQQAATTIGRITLEGAGIGVTASGTLDVSAEHLAINDVRAGQYHVRSIEGDKVRAGFDVSDGILGIADLRKNLTGVDVSAGGLTARGIENAEIGLTIDSATLLGLDEAQLARNEGNASARLVSRLVLVEGVRLKNLEAMLVAEKNYLQSRRTPGATLSPNEEARLATLSQKLAQLEALRSRVAQAETKRAKAKTEKQRQAVEAERAQAQQDLDRWAEGVIVGSLAVRDVDVEATGLGDVLSPDYDPSAALDRGIEITGRGGPSGSRMFSGATATDSSIPGLSGKKVTVGETSTRVLRNGLPSVSNTRPETVIRSPMGSPSCWRVRSASPGVITRASPSAGPVISVMVWGR